jgi:hypothetical protein
LSKRAMSAPRLPDEEVWQIGWPGAKQAAVTCLQLT